MSPARRRQAVVMLMDRLLISERRACRAMDQPRSTQRRPAPSRGPKKSTSEPGSESSLGPTPAMAIAA